MWLTRGSEGCVRSSITMCLKRSRITSRTRDTIRIVRISHLTTICLWEADSRIREPQRLNSRIRMFGTHLHLPKTLPRSHQVIGVPVVVGDRHNHLSAASLVHLRGVHRRDLLVAYLPAGTQPLGKDPVVGQREIEITISHGSNLQKRRRNPRRSWSIITRTVSAQMSSSFR